MGSRGRGGLGVGHATSPPLPPPLPRQPSSCHVPPLYTQSTMTPRYALLLALILISFASAQAPTTQPSRYFTIQVIDEQTGRGVPLVELKTVSSMRYYTDSAGLVAIDDPQYMDHEVFFSLFSHG